MSEQLTLKFKPGPPMEPIDWDLIHWAQSPLIRITCDGKLGRSGCLNRANVRATREGNYCVSCWDKLERCDMCGNRGSWKYSKLYPAKCANHTPSKYDDEQLRQRSRDILFRNRTWDCIVSQKFVREGEER